MPYVELHARSNFSFLGGGSHPEQLVHTAYALGLGGLALTDCNGFHGAVRFHQAAQQLGFPALIGTDVELDDGGTLTLLVRSPRGYARLSTLLTQAFFAGDRTRPKVSTADLLSDARGLVVLAGSASPVAALLNADQEVAAQEWMARAQSAAGTEQVFLEANRHLRPGEDRWLGRLDRFATRQGVPVVAANNVRYATTEDRILYDVLSCVREHTTLEQAGFVLEPNAERRLKSTQEMLALFPHHPHWVHGTAEVMAQCSFRMSDLEYHLPCFPTEGETPAAMLRRLSWEGAARRYGTLSERVVAQLEHELQLIDRLDLSGYFLIVWDIVRFCREQGTLCQGRGSAANSVVCYCLGITAVDPIGLDLLFERFLSPDRSEAPDIDLDIAHLYREEVIQYVYEKYGREHAAMVCEVISYKGRSAVRDVGKAIGLSLAQVDRIAKQIDSWVPSPLTGEGQDGGDRRLSACVGIHPLPGAGASGFPPQGGRELPAEWGVDSSSRQIQLLLALVQRIRGFPRHLSIHVGGMVISKAPLSTIVPVEPAAMPKRSIIQWDKDDAESAGFVKIDLLGLGMLTLLQRGFQLIRDVYGKRFELHELDYEDPAVYEMLCQADTVGVFQVESRAQMSCLPRLKPRTFYDLVVEVALIRPGPIQGEMVHPYLRRREGSEPVTFPHPQLIPILGRTLGIPLFQEQGMRVAITAAGFTAGEADQLRKAMGHKRSHERMQTLLDKLTRGMVDNGYSAEVAERIIHQLMAFADYGFPESHAASFALLVYASAWMKVHYPLAFYTALLNAQPMGFYSPATIIEDAKRHRVEIRPIDIQQSDYDCTVEDQSIRLGLRYVRGMGKAGEKKVRQVLSSRPFQDVDHAFHALRTLPVNLQRNLVTAGAFESFGLDRRAARWSFEKQARADDGPLIRHATEVPVNLPPMHRIEEMQADYTSTGVSIKDHPLTFYRSWLDARGCKRACDFRQARPGSTLEMGGLVICRQRPGTARGMLFITLEDETGMANLVIFPNVLAQFRTILRYKSLILVRGKLERAHDVSNLIVFDAHVLQPLEQLKQLTFFSRDFR